MKDTPLEIHILILTNQPACKENGALRDKLYYNYLITALGITLIMIMSKLTVYRL